MDAAAVAKHDDVIDVKLQLHAILGLAKLGSKTEEFFTGDCVLQSEMKQAV